MVPPLTRPPPNYYHVLGVSKTASLVEVQRAFVLACFLEHPDRRGGAVKAGSRFLIVADAYATLADPTARAQHDDTLKFSRDRTSWSPYHGPEAPHASWPTDIDMDDGNLLAAYANILVDAYALHIADPSRRLPMLVGVPPSLVNLLSTASGILIPLPKEREGKELLAAIVSMAEREVERSARESIKAKEDERKERRRIGRFRSSDITIGTPSAAPPPQARKNSGVRDLVAILEERSRLSEEEHMGTIKRGRRTSKESTKSTSSKMKKKVTFDDSVMPSRGGVEAGSQGASSESIHTAKPAVPPGEPTGPSTQVVVRLRDLDDNRPLYDSPQEVDYASDSDSSSISGTYESALDLYELGQADDGTSRTVASAEAPVGPSHPPSTVDPEPEESTSWIEKSRPGAKAPPRLTIQTANLVTMPVPDSVSPTTAKATEPAPAPASPTPPSLTTPIPPSPTASTATRRRVRDVIADKVKLPGKSKKSSTPKSTRSPSFLALGTPARKPSKKRSLSKRSSLPTPRRLRLDGSYPPITDEGFNAITRRPASPPRVSRESSLVPEQSEFDRIINSGLKPSRFLDDPHRVIDEVMALQIPSRPLHPPSRRAPTVRSSQSSAVQNMSSGEESLRPASTRSASVLSVATVDAKAPVTRRMSASPTKQPAPLNRVRTSSTTSTVCMRTSHHGATQCPPHPHRPIVRNVSSQSLDHRRRLASHPSTSSLPIPPAPDSFFKRMRDQSITDTEQPEQTIVFKRSGKKPATLRVTSPVFESTEGSSSTCGDESNSDSEHDPRFLLPSLVQTSSLTDSFSSDMVSTPSSVAINKPLPALPPPSSSSLRGLMSATGRRLTKDRGTQHRPISSILSSPPGGVDRSVPALAQPHFAARRSSSSIQFIDSAPTQPFPTDSRHRPGHSRQRSCPASLTSRHAKPASILNSSRADTHTTWHRTSIPISPPRPLGSSSRAPSVVITPPTPAKVHLDLGHWLGSMRRRKHQGEEAHEADSDPNNSHSHRPHPAPASASLYQNPNTSMHSVGKTRSVHSARSLRSVRRFVGGIFSRKKASD